MTQDKIISLARENCPYTKELLRGAYYEGFVKAANLIASPVRTKDLTDDEILEITKRFALGIAFPVNGVTTPEMFARAVIAADRENNK